MNEINKKDLLAQLEEVYDWPPKTGCHYFPYVDPDYALKRIALALAYIINHISEQTTKEGEK